MSFGPREFVHILFPPNVRHNGRAQHRAPRERRHAAGANVGGAGRLFLMLRGLLFELLWVACTAGGSRAAVSGRGPEDAHTLCCGRPPDDAHSLCADFLQWG